MAEVVIGTRGSTLALVQAGQVREKLLLHNPGLTCRVEIIKTRGDVVKEIPLHKIGDKGLFIKELEQALVDKKVDLAVHSLKDMPTALPESLALGAILKREDPRDAVIGNASFSSLASLPAGARVGTGSLRRQAQLRRHYPHLACLPIRGNLDTRLAKLRRGEYDAIVLALAGIRRMGWAELAGEILSPAVCLPAAGQGAIALEIRALDELTARLLAPLNCADTQAAVRAERAFLGELEGGCHIPVAALAETRGALLFLGGMVSSLDGREEYREELQGSREDPAALGRALAKKMLHLGCGQVLRELRKEDERL